MSSYGDIFRRCDSQQTEEPPLSSQGILRISRMQGIGSFLLHFTSPVDLLPFRHNGGTRVPQPSTRSFCILYSRALPASSHLPFPHPSLRIISRLARHVFSPRLPLFVVFILFHLLASVYFFPPRTVRVPALFTTLSCRLCRSLVLLLTFSSLSSLSFAL